MSVHTPTRALTRVNGPDQEKNILLRQQFASGTTENGDHISIIASGNTCVVHHANIRIDGTPASRSLDAADPKPGYEGLIAHSAVYPDGHFLGWTQGQFSPFLPKGLASSTPMSQ